MQANQSQVKADAKRLSVEERLCCSAIRCINPIVDVMNYVMVERTHARLRR